MSSWAELIEKVRVRQMAGEKSTLENAAYLPQLIVDVTDKDGAPVKGNFMYSIKCHNVHAEGSPRGIERV